MSLHQLAHNVQSAGRGDDKVLVHMTPKEVGGLQALAMAHGGSLTINPQTGLPEANFLKSLLPMLAGGALTVLSGGALSPLMASMIVGGGTAAATGSLQKGLMAGLGAYGGAGLGAGLAKTGAASAANAAGAAAPAQSFGMSTAPGASTSAFGSSQLGTALQGAKDASLVQSSNVAANLANTAQAPVTLGNIGSGVKALGESGGFSNLYNALPTGTLPAVGTTLAAGMVDRGEGPPKDSPGLIRPYTYERTQNPEAYDIGAPMYSETPGSSRERRYFNETYTALTPYEAPGPEYKKAAGGGLMGMAVGGPVEMMAAQNSVGANTGYPMAGINTAMYSNPMMQRPEATNVISPSADAGVGAYSGEQRFAGGGLPNLGDYSDGGRLLKGPGDGVSDSIPAVIGKRQPALLADGEFVVPARIVSEIGNGSTEAGARKLYAMMDRVQKARRKTVGKNKVAANTRSEKYLPA